MVNQLYGYQLITANHELLETWELPGALDCDSGAEAVDVVTELYGMIWKLAEDFAFEAGCGSPAMLIEAARENYKAGLLASPTKRFDSDWALKNLRHKLTNDTSPDDETVCEDHKPVQHRDGCEPWCEKCGLTNRFTRPVSKLGGRKA